jgi:16S rRNA (cytosine967-C5)-methyltransferase
LEAKTIELTDSGIQLTSPVDVSQLPGFDLGDCSVQDGAAQLAAPLLMLEPGQRVLDACSAPGGKTGHIAEAQPNLETLLALDSDPRRLQRVHDNLTRLGLDAELCEADASDLGAWWDQQLFDRILLDAPCSATGVIRRHPDIKLLRTAADIENLAAIQGRLLQSLWPTLKNNGVLVYATCSVLPRENDRVIEKFLHAHSDAQIYAIDADWGLQTNFGRQLFPLIGGQDGFYYARLQKRRNDI